MDAAANRAAEGLRVVEDYVRFVLDDRHLTEAWKSIRHELRELLVPLDATRRLAARQTPHDVGTEIPQPAASVRRDLAGVFAANAARLAQALRSLEETVKLLDPVRAARLESLRYRSYTLAAATESTRAAAQRLADVRLYVLIDGGGSTAEMESLVRNLVGAGVDAIQLRDKRLADRELLDRARRARQLTRDGQVLLIINDRPDLAVLSQADGVHVGQDELVVKDVRTVVGTDLLIGVSTHSLQQAGQAVLDGANYIGLGPVFPSDTKSFTQFPGVPLLREVAEQIELPAFAIGGITADRLPQVMSSGIRRIAVGRAVTASADVSAAVQRLREQLQSVG